MESQHRRRRCGRLDSISELISAGSRAIRVVWRPASNAMSSPSHSKRRGQAQMDGDLLELPPSLGTLDLPPQRAMQSPMPPCICVPSQQENSDTAAVCPRTYPVSTPEPLIGGRRLIAAEELSLVDPGGMALRGSRQVCVMSTEESSFKDQICQVEGLVGKEGVGAAENELASELKEVFVQNCLSVEIASMNLGPQWISVHELDEEGLLQDEMRPLYEVLLRAERAAHMNGR
jgi:hypothetical protein